MAVLCFAGIHCLRLSGKSKVGSALVKKKTHDAYEKEKCVLRSALGEIKSKADKEDTLLMP